MDFIFGIFIQIFSETILDLNKLDIAEEVEDGFIFAIFLLDTIIQDGDMRILILVLADLNK